MYIDPEFGEVIIRKNPHSRSVSFSISTSGRLQATIPNFVSESIIKKTIEKMRAQIRQKLHVRPARHPIRRQSLCGSSQKQNLPRSRTQLPLNTFRRPHPHQEAV